MAYEEKQDFPSTACLRFRIVMNGQIKDRTRGRQWCWTIELAGGQRESIKWLVFEYECLGLSICKENKDKCAYLSA